MPRQARLDAPATLHHVMVRGIERTTIFRDETDRADFVTRLAQLAGQGALMVYAWALLRAHLLVHTGTPRGKKHLRSSVGSRLLAPMPRGPTGASSPTGRPAAAGLW